MATPTPDTLADGRERKGWFTKKWRAMNDWGDDFERKHFDGDLKGSLTGTSSKATDVAANSWKAMNEFGQDVERRHFDGDFVGTLAQAPQLVGDALASSLDAFDETLLGVAPPVIYTDDFGYGGSGPSGSPAHTESAWAFGGPFAEGLPMPRERSSSSSSAPQSSWGQVKHIQDERRMQLDANNSATPALMEEVQRLRERLAEERERRRGRVAAIDALDEAASGHRKISAEERQAIAGAEEKRSKASLRSYGAERALAQLQEAHHAHLSRKAQNEAEMQQHSLAASKHAAALSKDEQLREEEGERAWARAGPEMEALKNAKLEVAEALGLLDHARLERRKELNKFQQEIEALATDNSRLKLAADGYVAPGGSFRQSVRRLFRVAAGGDDSDNHP